MNKDTPVSSMSLAELEKINREHADVLKACGVNFDELPPANKEEISQLVDYQQKTGLVNCDIGHLGQWYTDKWDDIFPYTLVIEKLKRETRDFDEEATDYENKLAQLEGYMKDILNAKPTEDDMKKDLELKRKDVERYNQQKQQQNSYADIDIDDIIAKLEALNKTK